MKPFAALAALFVLASAPPVGAQVTSSPPGDPPPLHLSDAVAWARAHHPSLASATARVKAAEQEPAMARSLMPPMLEAQIWQWPVTSINPADANMYMFMVQQDLPGRGKRALRAEAAERQVDVATAGVAVRERAVVTGVLAAYAALRATQREIDATRASKPAARDLVRATEVAYAAGRGMQAGVVRTALADTELTERIVMLDAEAARDRVALNVAMGRDPAAAIGPLDDTPPFPTVPALVELLDRASDLHPELAMGRAEVIQADAGLAVARTDRKPDWVVRGGYMLMPGGAGAWTASVGASWPTAPWARRRLSAATAEAQALADAAKADLEGTRQDIARRIADARATLAGVLSQLAVVRETMRPQTVHLVEASRLAFAAGQIPLAEVLDAEKMRLETEVQIARLSGQADLAWAELETAVGADLRPSTQTTLSHAAAGGTE
jgi:outer membrane protein, heavy metal efflux system